MKIEVSLTNAVPIGTDDTTGLHFSAGNVDKEDKQLVRSDGRW